ncbi:glycoside hydrolase family 27 protein [Granulicella paludicola]|uniref:glycoside hydrolase family 27 protein n=1 Tax=Granulicella paludicola TaxID=474951 RepID=UPI0021E0B4D4|nr:glycoside hydrolase family 27 protein [Granulicella paludicola]
MRVHVLTLVALAGCISAGGQMAAPRPPMGWNSWNHFAEHVTDADVRSAADALVSTGMKDAGYIYVNMDDTWQGKRDSQGVLHPNERFPDMKALGDYVHSKGLKFGIYSSPGAKTCGGYAGSLGHEEQDAKMYAEWGVDYLKYDLCSMQDQMADLREAHPESPMAEYEMMIGAFKKMGDALKATGRPIVYSLCQYGMDEPWRFGPGVGGSMWRTTDDINDTYQRMMTIAYGQAGLGKYAGPGHWNDPDMLEVGNGGMNADEYRTHMSLWAVMGAPLIAGNDLSKMSDVTKSILMNREVIAIDQDALGKGGDRTLQLGDFSVWERPLSGKRLAIALVNVSVSGRDIPVNLAQIGVPKGAKIHDVWGNKELRPVQGVLNERFPGHGVILLIVSE